MMHTPNRRQFLQLSSLLASTLWSQTQVSGDEVTGASKPTGIIDTHTHFYDPIRKEGIPWPSPQDDLLYRNVTPAEFIKVASPYGVTGTVVVEASPRLEDNQWLLDLADANSVVLGVVGNLDFTDRDFRKHLARFAKHSLFKGVRTKTPLIRMGEEKTVLANFQAFADAGLTLDINGPADGIADILSLKKNIPELRIVIEHLPKPPSRTLEQRQRDEEAMQEIASLSGIYAKVSHVLKAKTPESGLKLEAHRSALDNIWKTFGPDKVLYGSDWPVSGRVCSYGAVIGVVSEYVSHRSHEEADKFFRKNAETAYQLKRRDA